MTTGSSIDDSSIWQEHSRLRQQYGAYLLWDNGYWITVADTSFPDKQSAQTWCDRAGRDADHCFPRLIPAQQPAAPSPPPAPEVAVAPKVDPDQVFRNLVLQIPGIRSLNWADAEAGGRAICTYLSEGHTHVEAAQQVLQNNSTFVAWQASALVNASTTAYCPQYGG
jgi:Protein of unknown function (DUF732)